MKKQVEYLQKLFYDIWNDFGSVYLLVKHSGRTNIGKRGFTEDEKKQGLILVFNDKTNNALNWDAQGNLTCVLAFGAIREDIFIHHDDLAGIFSQEAGVQFIRSDMSREAAESSPRDADARQGGGNQVVSINSFKKKKTE